MEEISDEQLADRARGGDTAAFSELARRYHERIYGMILGMTRNPQDTADLVQETFLKAYRAVGRFKGHSSFYTWIYRIAMNLTLNALKRKAREKPRVDTELDLCPASPGPARQASSPEQNTLRLEFRNKLNEAIGALPLAYRSAFQLVEGQGMSHRQASRVLRCSENTVSWRIHKARRILQARLRPYWERGAL